MSDKVSNDILDLNNPGVMVEVSKEEAASLFLVLFADLVLRLHGIEIDWSKEGNQVILGIPFFFMAIATVSLLINISSNGLESIETREQNKPSLW